MLSAATKNFIMQDEIARKPFQLREGLIAKLH
jgi:hypothetical protein